MDQASEGKFRKRVQDAAEAALKHYGFVGPVELFINMQFLAGSLVEQWMKGNSHVAHIAETLQVGEAKFEKTMAIFNEWIQARGLKPVEMPYQRQSPRGVLVLQATKEGDAEEERFWATRFVADNLPPAKAKQVARKLAKLPDLVVFQKVSEEGNCSECQAELHKNSLIFKEKDNVLCMECADMGHLVYLPSGDATLSRRARKNSTLNAVVVRFNRSRKRYERQGILVSAAALDRAYKECEADAPERAALRERAKAQRVAEDDELTVEMTRAITKLFPRCPVREAREIALHTAERGSGRVGRSAKGKALDETALKLAVRAHIRHVHTNYDMRLMQGEERSAARESVRAQIDQRVQAWS